MTPARTIAIVGGGLSGTLVAANLLRAPHWANTLIVLIERARHVARGKAYVEREHPHLLRGPRLFESLLRGSLAARRSLGSHRRTRASGSRRGPGETSDPRRPAGAVGAATDNALTTCARAQARAAGAVGVIQTDAFNVGR